MENCKNLSGRGSAELPPEPPEPIYLLLFYLKEKQVKQNKKKPTNKQTKMKTIITVQNFVKTIMSNKYRVYRP